MELIAPTQRTFLKVQRAISLVCATSNTLEFGIGTNNLQYADNMGVNGSLGA
jgi:hypothetical protein